jgi:hypothetical protein
MFCLALKWCDDVMNIIQYIFESFNGFVEASSLMLTYYSLTLPCATSVHLNNCFM